MCICTLYTLNVYVYLFDSIVKSPLISNAVLLNEPSKEVHNDTTIVEKMRRKTRYPAQNEYEKYLKVV